MARGPLFNPAFNVAFNIGYSRGVNAAFNSAFQRTAPVRRPGDLRSAGTGDAGHLSDRVDDDETRDTSMTFLAYP
jgi:hypothetical protein